MIETVATAALALVLLLILIGSALGVLLIVMHGLLSRAEDDQHEFPAAPVPEREQQEDANHG